jgi:hypothetical protein
MLYRHLPVIWRPQQGISMAITVFRLILVLGTIVED